MPYALVAMIDVDADGQSALLAIRLGVPARAAIAPPRLRGSLRCGSTTGAVREE
jgi:hypothetical protein